MKKFSYPILCLIIGIGLFLRLYNLGTFGLYTDEKYTILNANGICVGGANQQDIFSKKYFSSNDFWKPKKTFDYYEAVARSDFGTHIVYNVVLKQWMNIFGNSDFYIRLLGGIINILTILLLFKLVNEYLKSYVIALLSAFLVAIEPLNVAQSHMARSYTLSFFLILLGTYLFLKLIENDKSTKQKYLLAMLYGLVAALSLLNHYLNFLVYLCHLLIAIFYERKPLHWILLSGAGIFTISVMAWWFTAGGGQWSMQFLKEKNEVHLKMANLPPEQNPLRGMVDKSTFKNVANKVIEIFLDLTPLSNGSFNSVLGFKNTFIIFLISLILFFLDKKRPTNKIVWAGAAFAIIALCLLFRGNILQTTPILLIFFLTFLVITYVLKHFKNVEKPTRIFVSLILLMSLLPMFYMVFDALKSGHTTSLSQRYVGNTIPFIAVLYAIALKQYFKKNSIFLVIGAICIAYQGFELSKTLTDILTDKSVKYTYFAEPRAANPFQKAAQMVLSNYTKGDTLIIPSKNTKIYQQIITNQPEVSVSDAQYLNVYFPKNANISQRINANEPNKLILKNSRGEEKLIFDFEDEKYRY